MQINPSLTFISPRNRHPWARKYLGLARRDEVLDNIALQAGVPPLPRRKPVPFLRLYTTCTGSGAMLTGVFVLGLAVWWCLSSVRTHWLDVSAIAMMGCALGVSLMLIAYTLHNYAHVRHFRDKLVYPPLVVQLYRQLITSGEITDCEVTSVEKRDDTSYCIGYQLTWPANGESGKGQYITDKPFPAGTKMAVMYLNAACQVLL